MRFQLLNEFVCGIRNEFTKVNSLGKCARVLHSLLLYTSIFPFNSYSICQFQCIKLRTTLYYIQLTHELKCKFIRSLVGCDECGTLLHIQISSLTSFISLFLHFIPFFLSRFTSHTLYIYVYYISHALQTKKKTINSILLTNFIGRLAFCKFTGILNFNQDFDPFENCTKN